MTAQDIGLIAWADRETAGDPTSPLKRTRKAEARAYVNALAAERQALDDRLTEQEATVLNGQKGYESWTVAAAVTGLSAGQLVSVEPSDTGSHTDPIVGGTVLNSGVYRYVTGSPSGLKRIGNYRGLTPASQAVVDGGTNVADPVTAGTLEGSQQVYALRTGLIRSLSLGPKVLVYGDSNHNYNTFAHPAGTLMYGNGRGVADVARCLNPRFNFDVVYDAAMPRYMNGANMGVSGETSAQFLARIDDVLRQRPAVVYLGAPTNDALQSDPGPTGSPATVTASLAASLANYKTIVTRLLSNGIVVIMTTLPPVGTGGTLGVPALDVRRAFWTGFNADIATWRPSIANDYNLYVHDVHTTMKDPASSVTGGVPRAGWVNSTDQVHLKTRAAHGLAPGFNTLMNRIVPLQEAYPPCDIGNLMPNWNLKGTGGTIDAVNGVTGVVADRGRVRHSTGGTASSVVASVSANARTKGQIQHLNFTLGGAATVETFDYRLVGPETVDTTALNGKWVVIAAHMHVVADGLRALYLEGGPMGDGRPEGLAADEEMGPLNGDYMLISPPYRFGVGNTSIAPNLGMHFGPSLASSGQIDLNWWALWDYGNPLVNRFLA